MKRLVCMICGCWIFVSAWTQTTPNELHLLTIATDKTTSLIFPFAIRHVDRGTPDILVQQVTEAENLLLVKAAVENFKETNLSVVTADGHLYSFTVTYDKQPLNWVFHFPPLVSPRNEEVSFESEWMNDRDLEIYSRGILDNKPNAHGVRDKKWDMLAKISGIYIKDEVIFFQISLVNLSPIDYDIDYIRFYIRDRKRGKRTATQEQEIIPLYKAGNTKLVKANSRNALVAAIQKFTIPDAKFFFIEIGEKNGGRHLRLKVTNTKLVKAGILPSYH